MANLLNSEELPNSFRYPPEFLRTIARGLMYFQPWYVFEGEELRGRHGDLQLRYPDRCLVPFARREDNDDVACFDVDQGGAPVVIHDFTTPGWEQRLSLDNFYTWLRIALDDMIEWDSFQ